MILYILISTIDEGIDTVSKVLLSKRNDVIYIISHQYTKEDFKNIPVDLAAREDVVISQLKEKGLSKSRNNALKLAQGDICLIADDDVKYKHEYFDLVISTFSKNTELDVATFKIKTLENEPEYKKYPKEKYCLNLSTKHFVSSVEIAFRTNSIKGQIWFDERFGVGTNYLIGGEEHIFLYDCLSLKKNVWYYPYYVVEHPYESNLKRISKYDIKINRLNGGIDYRLNGWTAIPNTFYLCLKSMPSLIRNKKNPFAFLYERLSGITYVMSS